MSSTIEEIEQSIREATAPGFRGRLLERGLARSMIWVDGELPEGHQDSLRNFLMIFYPMATHCYHLPYVCGI